MFMQSLFSRLLLIALSVCLIGHAQSDHYETRQLIDAVNAQSDPAKTGPYALVADVTINPGARDQQTGKLRLYRDKDRSRLELEIGQYQETDLRLQSKLYIARTSRRPFNVPSTLLSGDRLWRIDVPPRAKLSGIKYKKRDGVTAGCFSIKDPAWGDFKTDYCVDAAQNTLLETSTKYEKTTLLSSIGLGSGRLPTAIAYKELDSGQKLAISHVELGHILPQENIFAVPEHAREFETCDYIEGGSFVNKVEPVYPRGTGHRAATIYFRGIVQKDGSFTDVEVSSPDGPEFEAAGRAAAAQWKFSPPMCAGHPVAAESETTITLQPH
jgi:TonB-like protein